jgi:exosortase
MIAAALAALTLWAFWPALAEMANKWLTDPQYTHGYLVPVFSLYLLWARRDRLAGAKLAPSWWGLVPLAAAALMRFEASRNYSYFDGIALILTVTAFVVLAGGLKALEWSWPAVAFLMFMVPLPYKVETAAAYPLQTFATLCTTYLMQTIGLPAISEGHRIVLGSGPALEIEQACSGLSMLMIFFALATAMAILIRRPLLDRLVIVASAVPIAVIANVARITATGIAQVWFGPEAAQKIFHDWAGWMMMPLALGLLWLELGLMSLLLREVEEEDPQSPLTFDFSGGQAGPGPKNQRSVREGPLPGSQSSTLGVPPAGPTAIGALGS